ncbi:MAG: hypothetical protein BGO49_27215 [Planctomycetales bacterium 71-10]|nr:MAG: hypothetical protein BGO49_27215 [Planctomycetales bacterium 71-10]
MPQQDLSAFTPQIWSKRVLTRLDQINIMLALVNRDYEGDIKDVGDTVFVRTYGNVTVNPYKRGNPINYGALVPTKEALTINDAQTLAFEVDDLDEVQNDLRALDGYSARAAVALNNTVEAKCLSFYGKAPAANVLDDGSVDTATNGGAGNPVIVSKANAYELFVKAGKALDQQNAPDMGRWAVVDPDFKAALLRDTSYFIRATDMGDEVVTTGRLPRAAKNTPGFIGRVSNFDVYCSNALPVSGTTRYCQYGAGPVISYAGQLRKVETIRRETTFATAVRGLLLHDGTVFAEHAKAFGVIQKKVA